MKPTQARGLAQGAPPPPPERAETDGHMLSSVLLSSPAERSPCFGPLSWAVPGTDLMTFTAIGGLAIPIKDETDLLGQAEHQDISSFQLMSRNLMPDPRAGRVSGSWDGLEPWTAEVLQGGPGGWVQHCPKLCWRKTSGKTYLCTCIEGREACLDQSSNRTPV